MKTIQDEVEERTKLAGTNRFEMLIFLLGNSREGESSEMFGINVFKVREVLVMPKITELVSSHKHIMGVADIRGQLIRVINLPAVVGCTPSKGLKNLMVTEFGRTIQAFAVEDVKEIVQLDWSNVLPSESNGPENFITGLAKVNAGQLGQKLVQVLDVEQILKTVLPTSEEEIGKDVVGPPMVLPKGKSLLVADDSAVARTVIEIGLKAMSVPYVMTKTGKEAWEYVTEHVDEIAMVLSDLEMPEMDGFTLTKLIKNNPLTAHLPVVIHSSLTGSNNESLVKSVGADGYVAKFAPRELAKAIRQALDSADR